MDREDYEEGAGEGTGLGVFAGQRENSKDRTIWEDRVVMTGLGWKMGLKAGLGRENGTRGSAGAGDRADT